MSILSSLLMAGASLATIRTVSNDPNRPGMYPNFPAAYIDAIDNDTIFIYSSPFTTDVGAATVSKLLHIVGNGYDSNQPGYRSRLGPIIFDAGSEGSTVEGVTAHFGIRVNSVANIQVRNCLVKNLNTYNPIMIEGSATITVTGCIIGSEVSDGGVAQAPAIYALGTVTGPNYFYNNIFISNTNPNPGLNVFISGVQSTGLSNTTFENNVFLTWTTSSQLSDHPFSNCAFANNIFYNVATVSSNCDFCSFSNNLVTGCTDCNLITGTQTGGSNIFDVAAFNSYSGGSWDLVANDLALQPGTPGTLAGTDNMDVGLYGGPYPMVPGTLHNQLLTIIPYISSFNIANPVIPETTGGPLQISSGATIVNE